MACRFNVGNLSEERTIGIMIGMEAVAAVEGSKVVSMEAVERGYGCRVGSKGVVATEEGIDDVGKELLAFERMA